MEELVATLKRTFEALENGKGYPFTIEKKESKEFLGRTSIRKSRQVNEFV